MLDVKTVRAIRNKRPTFRRTEWHKRKKLQRTGWRRPRGFHSKLRFFHKGKGERVRIGYKSPAEIRGKHVSGKDIVRVSSLEELKPLNKSQHVVVISRTLGARKKIKLLNEAKSRGIEVIGLNGEKYIKRIEAERAKKKVDLKARLDKRTKKRKLLEKVAKKNDEKLEAKVDKESKPAEAMLPAGKLAGKSTSGDQVNITYFVHGSTKDNEKNISTGQVDVDLSDKGRDQAIELGEKIKDQSFDVVFTSDLKRAADSAKLAFGNKAKIIKDKRLREIDYGELSQSPKADVDAIRATHIEKQFPKGESYKDVEKRVGSLLDEVAKDYAGKRVAFMAHQAPQLALDVLTKGKTWEQAITEDWRSKKPAAWQPGWAYEVEAKKEEKKLTPKAEPKEDKSTSIDAAKESPKAIPKKAETPKEAHKK